MKSITERRETILQMIAELETLRPRIEAAGTSPTHYAYTRPRALLRVAGYVCTAIVVATFLGILLFAGGRLSGTPGIIFVSITVPCFVFAVAAHWMTETLEKTYVLASQKTAKELEQSLARYQTMVEEFEQRKREAEIYRSKFDQLYHIITCELKGTYKPHWQIERHFVIRIGFGQYKAENYKLNRTDYAKLLARIIESRSEQGDDTQLTEFIQSCESILRL